MIGLTVLAAIGFFAKFKYQYDAAHGPARGRAPRADRRREAGPMTEPSMFTTRLEGPAPEVEVSTDIVKRGLIVAPLIIAICGVIWGADGAWSSVYGIGLVLVNFVLAAGDHRDDGPDLARADDGRRRCSATCSASG